MLVFIDTKNNLIIIIQHLNYFFKKKVYFRNCLKYSLYLYINIYEFSPDRADFSHIHVKFCKPKTYLLYIDIQMEVHRCTTSSTFYISWKMYQPHHGNMKIFYKIIFFFKNLKTTKSLGFVINLKVKQGNCTGKLKLENQN